jgi:hypothetical protein
MTRSASASIERSQFEAFLIAPIGLQQNGMLLSVLSALARLDIDPWHEAASLAKMSTEAATERMRLLIAALPEETSARSNADEIAARLIALLPPRQVISRPMSSKITAGNTGVPANYRVIIFLILMALLMGPQLLMRSAQSPAQADSVHGSAPSIVSSPNAPQ